MEDKKFNVHLPEGTTKLEILEGQFRHEEITKQKVAISGTITAPGLYVEHLRKKDKLNLFEPVVTVDMDNLSIKYDGDPRDSYGDKVSGKLVVDSFLETIGINTEKRYTLEQLKVFAKRNRYYFPDSTQHMNFVNSLSDFKLKLQREIESKNDDRGNKTSVNNTSILDNQLPFFFDLNLPIFKGCPAVRFTVDVCLDVQGNGVVFWLDSTGLKEAFDKQKEEIMKEEIAKFEGLNVIYI